MCSKSSLAMEAILLGKCNKSSSAYVSPLAFFFFFFSCFFSTVMILLFGSLLVCFFSIFYFLYFLNKKVPPDKYFEIGHFLLPVNDCRSCSWSIVILSICTFSKWVRHFLCCCSLVFARCQSVKLGYRFCHYCSLTQFFFLSICGRVPFIFIILKYFYSIM